MGFCAIVMLAGVVSAQCPDSDAYKDELLPIIQQTREESTRAAAIEALVSIAEDTNECYATREGALMALPSNVPASIIDRVKVLAEKKEEPAEERLAFEWSGPQDLLDTAATTYWRIEANSLSNPNDQKALWLQLLHRENPWPRSDWLPGFAHSALVNLGDKDLLPELLDYTRRTRGGSFGGEEEVWLVEKKVTLLSEHKTRLEAYQAALLGDDPTHDQKLRYWAVSGLANLGTSEAFDVLIDYARRLQEEHYDMDDEGMPVGSGSPTGDATMTYRHIVGSLRTQGWSTEQLESVGVYPGKYFWITGEGPA